VKHFFRGVQPQRVLLVETELWPHWLLRAHAEGVPVAIVSARLSERSRQRYRGFGGEFRWLVSRLAAVLCQTESDQARWLSIGAPRDRTTVVGNLKHDALPDAPVDRGAARLRCRLERERPTLVLGSVRPGEARPLATAWRALPDTVRGAWQVVAVPRHARAAADLQAEAASGGVHATNGVPRGDAWRWDARPGVLAGYYAAADVAFVGGSLRPYGGHNPMEPAALGCAVIMGRHVRSQAHSVRTLESFGAIEIASDAPRLAAAFAQLVLDPDARLAQAARGREAVRSLRGAAKRAAGQLAAWGLWPVE
jgi:3-deoxy-D-manno-octulosonic-acid transferase